MLWGRLTAKYQQADLGPHQGGVPKFKERPLATSARTAAALQSTAQTPRSSPSSRLSASYATWATCIMYGLSIPMCNARHNDSAKILSEDSKLRP